MSHLAMRTAAAYLAEGLVSRADALATVREYVDLSSSGRGSRVIQVALAGGLTFEVLPDRGLDIGALWYGDTPVAWRSPLVSGGNASGDSQSSFLARFGGMLVTCGLENIGAADDGRQFHGSHHRSPASEVHWVREVIGENVVVTVSGTIGSIEFFGRRIILERQIIARTGHASVEVLDKIRNEGYEPHPVALLYHVNFGAPFLEPGARIDIQAARVLAREEPPVIPDPSIMPPPTSAMEEAVFEYEQLKQVDGWSAAVVRPPRGNFLARLEWPAATLPRAFEWIWPTRGGWGLGIEPANSPLFGPARNHPHNGAPMLDPGATFVAGIRLSFEALQASGIDKP